MRVLHVYKDVYPPVAGGIERHIHAIRRALPELEHDVLVCSRTLRTSVRQASPGISGREVLVGELARPLGTPLAPTFPYWFRRLSKGAVVHLHMPNPTGEVSSLIALGSAPLVVTYYCDIFRQRALLPAYKPVQLRCLARARAVLVLSRAIAASSPVLQEYRGETKVIPCGVDTEFFDSSQAAEPVVRDLRHRFGDTHVVAVGRLVAYKGFEYLVDAAARLRWPVVIIGAGPEREKLVERIRQRGLAERVHLVGAVDDRRLRDHLAAGSVFAMSSVNRAEAFGISLIEAQAVGLPVVATDVGTGTKHALRPGESGLLVAPRDPVALADAIESILDDPRRAESMGELGRDWVRETHSIAMLAQTLRPIYADVAATPGNR